MLQSSQINPEAHSLQGVITWLIHLLKYMENCAVLNCLHYSCY